MASSADKQPSIDELLDRASTALQRGDPRTARRLANEVLAADTTNVEAGDLLLSAAASLGGEQRRLTIVFCDLVESTALSGRLDPETYRLIVGRYKEICRRILVDRFGGHIAQVKGDGLLAVFGMAAVREDDAQRAVRATLDILGELRLFSAETERALGVELTARAAVHHGLVFADEEEDEIYGLAANVAARLQSLADPGTVVVSKEVYQLVERFFAIEPRPEQHVKGVEDPVQPYVVVSALPTYARPRSSSPFVGRDDELDALLAVWRGRDASAQTAVIELSGEPGMGKSRLAAALAEHVRMEGFPITELFGSRLHSEVGLHPIRELLELHCGSPEIGATNLLAALKKQVRSLELPESATSLLAPVLGLAPDAGYQPAQADPRRLGDEIADAAFRYVRAWVGDIPALLVVEDLHWIDDATRKVLERLIANGPPGFMVIITGRPGTRPLSGARAQTIELGPLPAAAALTLVDALAARALSPQERQLLVARGDGVPLFITELARWAFEVPTGVTKPTNGTVRHAEVPEVLYEPLEARLSARPGLAPVASAAAALGREVSPALLAEAADLDPLTTEAALAALTEEGILERTAVGETDQYRFRHELLRQVAYDLLPNSARRRVHSRIANALRRRAAEGVADWPVLASHFERAGQVSETIASWAHAAQAAGHRGALSEARAHLTHGLELVPRLADESARRRWEIRLRISRGLLGVTMEGFSCPTAAEDYERALELALDSSTDDEVDAALTAIWTYHASRGEFDRSRRVLEILRDWDDREPWFIALNEAAFGVEDWFGGRFVEARQHLEAGVAGFARRRVVKQFMGGWLFPNDGAISMRAHLAQARMMAGDPAAAIREAVSSLRAADRLPFPQGPFSRAYVRTYEGWIRFELGDYAGARRSAADITRLADAHGFDFFSVVGVVHTAAVDGVAALAKGRDQAAIGNEAAILDGCITALRMTGTILFVPFFLTRLATLLAAAGDADGAAQRLDEALDFARRMGVAFYEAETLRVQARLLGASDKERGEEGLVLAWDVARHQGAVPFALRIALDLVELKGSEALPQLRLAVAAFAPGASCAELDRARTFLTAAR
jgi:class 3 adenylate cyclase